MIKDVSQPVQKIIMNLMYNFDKLGSRRREWQDETVTFRFWNFEDFSIFLSYQ